ncbi:MAG: hypothetical protein AAB074_06300 [Planctomycetota bacterium]
MRHFAILPLSLVLSLSPRAEDKPDLRQEAADKASARVAKLHLDGGGTDKMSDELKAISDEFSAASAPAGGALAIASSDGKLIFVVGGKGARDGYTVAVATPPKGSTVLLRGGDDDLIPKNDVEAVADSVEKLNVAWEDAEKRKAAIEEISKHRPTRGVIAAFSIDGKLLVLIGANGDDRNPDGASVEIAGKVAEKMVAIAGNARQKGKPGTAKAPEGTVTVNGK